MNYLDIPETSFGKSIIDVAASMIDGGLPRNDGFLLAAIRRLDSEDFAASLAARIAKLEDALEKEKDKFSACYKALDLLNKHYNDLATSNPGFLGKLVLQDYALLNEAFIAVEAFFRAKNENS